MFSMFQPLTPTSSSPIFLKHIWTNIKIHDRKTYKHCFLMFLSCMLFMCLKKPTGDVVLEIHRHTSEAVPKMEIPRRRMHQPDNLQNTKMHTNVFWMPHHVAVNKPNSTNAFVIQLFYYIFSLVLYTLLDSVFPETPDSEPFISETRSYQPWQVRLSNNIYNNILLFYVLLYNFIGFCMFRRRELDGRFPERFGPPPHASGGGAP